MYGKIKKNVKIKLPIKVGNTSTKNISHDDDDHKCSAVIIDIPVELEPDLNETCWIHRVPRKLRMQNEAAYTPQLVSIGPFHYGKPEFKSMEDHKTKYQKKFWNRSFCKHLKLNGVIKYFMTQKDLIGRIRKCYAGTFEHLDDDVFSQVILRDVCFIFELFLRNKDRCSTDDYILRTPWLKNTIDLDLILLENQLPFFVFTELFDFILLYQQPDGEIPTYLSKRQDESKRRDTLLILAVEFFEDFYRNGIAFDPDKTQEKPLIPVPAAANDVRQDQAQAQTPNKWSISEWVPRERERLNKVKHFTDLVRKFLCPEKYIPKSSNSIGCSYGATKLDRAGVNFVARRNHHLAEVECHKYKCITCVSMKVEIPKLLVESTTECVMRNVMALEQCVYPSEPHICNYIDLLDQLIDTPEDVELLVEKKIIEHTFGSNNEVADLVNELSNQTVQNSIIYGDLYDHLNGQYDNPWGHFKETFKRVYLKDLWTASSSIFGLAVTLFSVISVISTIKDMISG